MPWSFGAEGSLRGCAQRVSGSGRDAAADRADALAEWTPGERVLPPAYWMFARSAQVRSGLSRLTQVRRG